MAVRLLENEQTRQPRVRTFEDNIRTGRVRTEQRAQEIKSSSLQEVAGLRQAAEQSGLDTSSLPKRGEDPQEIFSGGVVSGVFDALNALQYGVVGTLQGKTFVEGVITRSSFTDKDYLGGKGPAGFILGIALDIAFDPLTYIAPATVLRKFGITGAAKGLAKTAGNIPLPKAITQSKFGVKKGIKDTLGDQLGTMFIYRYGQDPVYKQLADRAILAKERAIEAGVKLVKPMAKLNIDAQKAITAARKSGDLSSLSDDLYSKAAPAFEELDRLGKEAVDLKLLDSETYYDNVGKYMPRLYRKWEEPGRALSKDEVVKEFFDSKRMSALTDRFKKRTDIPEEIREAMGEIMEAGYPTAKGIMQLTRAVENAKFFNTVDNLFAKINPAPGLTKLPDSKRLASLSGKYVPEYLADDINEIIRTASALEEISKPIVGTFKFAKVILNPATHARNIMSNQILNSFEGLVPGHPAYFRAARELAKKGPIYQEAQRFGLGVDSFAAQEIGEFLQSKALRKSSQQVRDSLKWIANKYQKEEEWAKMAQYIYQTRSKGLSPEDAWKIAERATFNYAQVTPFIRHMRTAIYGMPFITFTYKATPQVIKTALQNPARLSVYGKIKEAVENQSDQEELAAERASEPPWVKDGFYMKLPGKDREGRSAYLDLTYIIPFGDLIGGNLLKRDIDRESGFQQTYLQSAAEQSLGYNIIQELVSNQDFYGNKIYKDSASEEQWAADVGRYLFQTFAPPLATDVLPGGYREDGDRRERTWTRVMNVEEGGVEAGGAQTRTLPQEVLRNVGIKINPVDLGVQNAFSELQEQKGLETLLRENGIIGSFDINYLRDDQR